jgi:uncharacterized beta-barrel protein YwiB (DUF1934 family)
MIKKVSVTIECRQLDDEDEVITNTAFGEYDYCNGKHYIRYDEYMENQKDLVRNIIIIEKDRIRIKRKGAVIAVMVFDMRESAPTVYKTPYGILNFNICTTRMQVEEKCDIIIINLCYTLAAGGKHISDNRMVIRVSAVR